MKYCIKNTENNLGFSRPEFKQITSSELDLLVDADEVYLGDILWVDENILKLLASKVKPGTILYVENIDIYEYIKGFWLDPNNINSFNKIFFNSGYTKVLDRAMIQKLIVDNGFNILFEVLDAGRVLITFKKN